VPRRALLAVFMLLVVHVSADGQASSDTAVDTAVGPMKEFAPDSKAYEEYSRKVDKEAERTKRDMLDTSVAKGDKAKAPDQFLTSASYQKYMSTILRKAEPAKNGFKPHRHGDASMMFLKQGGLGEGNAPPGVAGGDAKPPSGVREVARGKPTAQSSIQFSAVSSRAVDGRTDTMFNQGSCTHTLQNENPWWRVDLGKTMNIQDLEVWNRGDCCGSRLSNFEVRIGDATEWKKNPKCGNRWTVGQGQNVKIPCNTLQGRYVFIVIRATQQLSLCEVKVYASDNPGANAARGMPAAQSSTKKGATADRAVDGRSTVNFAGNSCTHTEYESNPWWRVDLAKPRTVKSVQIWNRGDCCGSRLSNFEVRVGDSAAAWSSSKQCGGKWSIPQGQNKEISCGGSRGRYVWVVIRARQVLSLCEVRVLTQYAKKGVNLARDKPASQSSTGYGGVAKRAVDGNVDTNAKHGSCTHTHMNNEPWWSVDLLKPHAIGAVQIWNRGDCCGARLSNFEVRVGNQPKWPGNSVCGNKKHKVAQGKRGTILCNGLLGRYVFIVVRTQSTYLHICEVRVLPWKGVKQGGCMSEALGMESRKIQKGSLTASSFFGEKEENGPNNARLNYRGNSWLPLHNREGQWLQVQLPKPIKVTSISTQGDFKSDKWVTHYKVRYMDNSGKWQWIGGHSATTFAGNVDRNTVSRKRFAAPVKTSKIRVYPTKWASSIAMRIELYGRECNKEVKMLTKAEGGGNAQAAARCGSRRRSLKLEAAQGYGTGTAQLWYAATQGSKQHGSFGKSVYVSEGVDFRTQGGSIYAAKDLVAAKFLQVQAWPGFGSGSAKLWYAKRARKTFHANTLYLQKGDFRTRKGSIYSAEDIQAGRFLGVRAYPGFGDGHAKFWYSASGTTKAGTDFESKTVYLESGNLATQRGSIFSAKDVRASRYLSLKAFPKYGTGTAQFWYVGAGKAPFKSNTVYLQSGNFATQQGSISAKYDVHASQYLRLSALEGYGTGETQFWYAKLERNGYGPDTTYLKTGDFSVLDGSISAAKNVVAGRSVEIRAWPGYGSGSANLWYSQSGKADFKPNSLYLKSGDFRTEVGSIVAAKDIVAGRAVKVMSLPGHGRGEAELFYSHTAKGSFSAETLYLKSGDFRTQHGSIFAGDSLRTSKYLEIRAYPGFGSGSAKFWHSNKEKEGFKSNTLYLKNGDFRTQVGSIFAAKDLVAGRYLTIHAKEGYGSGHTKLWYSKTGKNEYRSNSLYLASGDFRTESGSIHAAADLHASRYLKIAAWPGHGRGYAKLWHSKTGHKGYGRNTLYLNSGNFEVQKGSLIASKDISVGRYLKLGALTGYGSGSTQLWYSGTGKGNIFPQTLYLQSGDFRTQQGNIISAKDVVAGGTLYGAKLDVKYAYVPGQITAGHLYLGGTAKSDKPEPHVQTGQTPSEMETMTLLDVDSKQEQAPIEVGKMLQDLANNNADLMSRNAMLHKELQGVLSRLDMLQRSSR